MLRSMKVTMLAAWLLAMPAQASEQPELSLDVSLASSDLPTGIANTTYLKIGLTGFSATSRVDRPAVNVALVIDTSSSMRGAKIERAKQAAMAVIDRLRPDDVLSAIVYHDGVQVVLPAAKLRDKASAKTAIQSIRVDGSTSLFAGISKGIAEARKYLKADRVNRIILLSDGTANVGPDSPGELAELSASLLKENIAVTTMGLGLDFNEDLMIQLAIPSHGNHFFVEAADDLVATFRQEFDEIFSVVAQDLHINVKLNDDIRPVRVLGCEADVHGQRVSLRLNQIYADQERFVLVELEVPATPSVSQKIATTTVEYFNLATKSRDRLTASTEVRFTKDPRQQTYSRNNDVAEKTALLLANENNRRATILRDQGKVDEARRLLFSNYDFLSEKARELNSQLLTQQRTLNRLQAVNIGLDWKRTRKLMVRDHAAIQQQSLGYDGNSLKDAREPFPAANHSGYGSGYVEDATTLGDENSQLIKIPHEPMPTQQREATK